jgi:predicted metal-dependent phosphoesterase TrpH
MPPEEIIKVAAGMNLSAISITDHDTIDGYQKAFGISNEYSIELIPGVEITTSFNDRECHLLAYYFEPDNKNLNDLLNHHRKARVQRAQWIVKQLHKKGLELDIHEVLAEADGSNVGRPHIAAILVNKGYVGTQKEAFIRYLSDESLGSIKNDYGEIGDVIDIVKQAGGAAVLAHPGRLYTTDEQQMLVETGIDGLEVVHPSHNYGIQHELEEFVQKNQLLSTGGSDFHGVKKSYYRNFGSLTISAQWVNKLRTLTDQRKEISV